MGRQSDNEAWRLIFAGPPKYKSYKPRNIPDAPQNVLLPKEATGPAYTSPFAGQQLWNNNKDGNKKFTVATVQSEKPLTTAQHNKLINKLKNVTAI